MSETKNNMNDSLLPSAEVINISETGEKELLLPKIQEEYKNIPGAAVDGVTEAPSRKERDRKTLRRYSQNEVASEVRELKFGSLRNEEPPKTRVVFVTNAVSTAKYTMLTFFPKNLFEQITKLANTYFLLLSILQCIPSISITNGKPTILMPLSIVILVSMVKDFIEDRKRQKSDDQENNSKVLILQQSGQFEVKRWRDLKVGDIVKVNRNGFFPADLVLINSSVPKGICYVETKNLDGETNLKYKMAHKDTVVMIKSEEDLTKFTGTILCEKPNSALYNFEGALKMGDNIIPLSAEQLLLRGSSLRNTEYVYGIVIYTGAESKIQMNSSKAKGKCSIIEALTHRQIILIFMFQLTASAICAISAMFWVAVHPEFARGYLEINYSEGKESSWWLLLKLFSSWLLMTVQVVPLSLLITLEVVRYAQAAFISWDAKMFDEETQIFPSVQASNLNEELGMVNYIFSDKTGTLTCNIMEFKMLAVGKMRFGSFDSQMEPVPGVTNVNFVSPEMFEYLRDAKYENTKKRAKVQRMTLFLAVCHTIVIEETKEGNIWNSASPDELALVNAAKLMGYEFVGRDSEGAVLISEEGKTVKYPLLNVLEFNSTRKRMSVIVRTPDNKIVLFCKGADNMIYDRLHTSSKYRKEVEEFMLDCGNKGLRTLALAQREISEEEYAEWNASYIEASRAVNGRAKRLAEEAEKIEKEMFLVGSTAIEDKLQEEVGETIHFIKSAGIKFWVLTGDKMETAINIAFSCRLLTKHSIRGVVDSRDPAEVMEQLQKIREDIGSYSEGKLKNFALIITGDALIKIMGRPDIRSVLIEVCSITPAVIACRVSPKQKADIVNLVRNNDKNAVSLSIGDGANDVNMITAAHVGVGIRGLEGQQAARASDYAITKFKHLKNLLFVHGREATRRNGYTICYCFFKNVILIVPTIAYAIWSCGSAQPLYDDWLYQLYNTIFTTAPIVYFAVFDKEYEREDFLSDSQLYAPSRNCEYFNNWVFWRWMRDGVWQGLVILLVPLYTLANNPAENNGILEGLGFIGNLIFTLVVVVANLKILVAYNTHSIGSLFLTLGSIVIYYPIYFGISTSPSQGIYGSFGRLFINVMSLFTQIFVIAALLLWDVIVQQSKRILKEIFQMIDQRLTQTKTKEDDSVITMISSCLRNRRHWVRLQPGPRTNAPASHHRSQV